MPSKTGRIVAEAFRYGESRWVRDTTSIKFGGLLYLIYKEHILANMHPSSNFIYVRVGKCIGNGPISDRINSLFKVCREDRKVVQINGDTFITNLDKEMTKLEEDSVYSIKLKEGLR